jgi:hypothetical protein
MLNTIYEGSTEERIIPPSPIVQQSLAGQGLLICEDLRSHSDTPHSVAIPRRMITPNQRPLPDNIKNSQETGTYVSAGYETTIPASEQSADPRLRPRGHWDQKVILCYGLRNKRH